GQIHTFLGLTVGLNKANLEQHEKIIAYNCDITYGTGNEFGFDYLRDHMVYDKNQQVQRGQHFAIIDEIDSILIDEARTPLIIANKSNVSAELFQITSLLVKGFKEKEDFELNLSNRQVHLTDIGAKKIENSFGIENVYDAEHQLLLHFVTQSLQAQYILRRDTDYIVKDGKVELVDAFTGRVMEGRSLSHGLHQAIEAKEGLKINEENETQATVTIQNYFRMYSRLSGMTGSAIPAQSEFMEIYGLDVIEVPTNRPNIRNDLPDLVYKNLEAKYDKVIEEVKSYHQQGRPILIGTTSIEQSEHVSSLLRKINLQHQLLNAKNEENEAKLVAQAGQKGQITIATNMAGRGTDILLGDGVAELGGLHIIGTERHESQRIDMQLRGRAGRQGDPGSTQFIISIEDDLLHRFDEEEQERWIKRVKTNEEGLIISPNPVQFINKVQETIENNYFSARVDLLKLEDVLDQQRKIVYQKRNFILESENIEELILDKMDAVISNLIKITCLPGLSSEDWDIDNLHYHLSQLMPVSGKEDFVDLEETELIRKINEKFTSYKQLIASYFELESSQTEMKQITLQELDQHWIRHLGDMETLRDGIHLRSYGQEDPYRLFAKEGYQLFENMMMEYDLSSSKHLYSLINRNSHGEEE
ncbi:MAG: accessory Sec system translocase SecA2, partial [Heyndrickxia sp.]